MYNAKTAKKVLSFDDIVFIERPLLRLPVVARLV